MFNLYYHKNNNEYFYCLNRDQLGQYWQCVVEGRDSFCPRRCDQCNICKEMSDVFTESQDSYFFYPKTSVANNHEEVPYQPVLWRVFTSVIDKNNKKFQIEMGRHVDRAFIWFLIKQHYLYKQNHHKLCNCYICKRLHSLLSEIKRWSFYDLNRFHANGL